MLPVLFIGHGSPMNAIEENEFSLGWKKVARAIPRPKCILVISAHWLTKGTKILAVQRPKTIYDFYGFPQELYNVKYDSSNDLGVVFRIKELLPNSEMDYSWGYDHGAWSVLHVMYPKADIPVVQLSLDYYATNEELYSIGQKLSILRNEGVLIIGSGNIVHNLRLARFNHRYPWAETFDEYIYQNIMVGNHKAIINYASIGDTSKLSVPTSEHFNPLLIVLGAISKNDEVTVFNRGTFAGTVSMTSYIFNEKENL